jgi:hypothetical protein
MKTLLVLVILGASGLFGPSLLENTSNSCNALEKRLIALASVASQYPQDAVAGAFVLSMLQGASNGRFAETLMTRRFPQLPSGISCAMGYWESILNPPTPNDLRRLSQT